MYMHCSHNTQRSKFNRDPTRQNNERTIKNYACHVIYALRDLKNEESGARYFEELCKRVKSDNTVKNLQ